MIKPPLVHGEVTYDHFRWLGIRVGTIIDARVHEKARIPAALLTIDLGDAGVATSVAQLLDHYSLQQLVGKQIVCVTGLGTKRIAGVKSEVLCLAAVTSSGSILVCPDLGAPNGSEV